jgi:anti-sigma regulatory factor (Ser/Thr protein kinase)
LVDEVYQQHDIGVQPGDLLFLYSDGFTEARNAQGEEFGIERLRSLVQTMQASDIPVTILVQLIRKTVRDFENLEFPSDDRTCLALHFDRPAGGDATTLSLDLRWELGALAQMRQSIKEFAAAAGLNEAARDALILAAFEVATNVIRHADQHLHDNTLHVRLQDKGHSVEVSFYYVGERFEPGYRKTDFSGLSEGGFGLYIISNSVDEVVYDSPAPGVARARLSQRKDQRPGRDIPG